MSATLVLRENIGVPLTIQQVDNNFSNLDAATSAETQRAIAAETALSNSISSLSAPKNVSFTTLTNVPIASSTVLGLVKVDGTSITINNGIISSTGGTGGGTTYTGSGGITVLGSNIGFSGSAISANAIPWASVAKPTTLGGYGILAGTGISFSGMTISSTATGGGATYTAGTGINITGTTISSTVTGGTTYTAGTGISISGTTISATPYTAGTGISISGTTISSTATGGTDFASLSAPNTFASLNIFNSGVSVTAPGNVSYTPYNIPILSCGLGIFSGAATTASIYAVETNSAYSAWLDTRGSTATGIVQVLSTTNSTGSFISCFKSGNDYSALAPIVAFNVSANGSVAGGSVYGQIKADYAEFFEWKDLNPKNEDRVGQCVVLDSGMIRGYLATDSISDIIGVISGTGAVIGNCADFAWVSRILVDDFGRTVTIDIPMAKWIDADGRETKVIISEAKADNIIIPVTAKLFMGKEEVINPLWDDTTHNDYVGRNDRPEWGIVGLLGQLWVKKGQPIKPEWKPLGKTNASATLYLIK